MKRAFSSFLVVLFVLGVLIVPAIHKAHCVDNDADHHAEDCPVCRLAAASLVSVIPLVTPVIQPVVVGDAGVAAPVAVSSSQRDPVQARAPPACRA